MPVYTDPRTFKQIIQPGLAVRADGESCIDITHDAIRLRAVSEDKTSSVDYRIPTPCPTLSVENAHSSFWIPGNRVAGIMRAGPDSPITLTTPTETANSTLLLEADWLSYELSPLNSQHTHRVTSNLSGETTGECVLKHGAFARAVRAANLFGGTMQIYLAPVTKTIEFSATNRYTNNSFSYSLPTPQITRIQGDASTLTISIERLREIIEAIPCTARISLQFNTTHLTYRVTYPNTGAELTMQIAKRLSTIQ